LPGGSRGLGDVYKRQEHMGYLLSDLQYMQRAYPNMEW
jgi:hypothetical protein